MTHKQRKWIQKTKSRPPGLRGRTGQTFSSRYTSIIKITMGGVTFDTTIQRYVRPHGWRSQGWRQDAADNKSEGSRKGQANYLWIPRRSGHIYKGPSPLGGTLSHKHSPTPSLTGSPRHQWRNRPIQLPGRHQLQQHPQWLHLQLFRRVLLMWHEEFTEDNNISQDTGSSSVSRCLVKGCVKFVWTVKTEYTLYSTKYLRYSCKFKQHNTIFLTNNISLTTRSHRILKLRFSTPLPSKSHQTPSPGSCTCSHLAP